MADKIALFVDRDRVGVAMSKLHFQRIADFIIDTVMESGEISLTQLMSLPPVELPDFTGDYRWSLLQVKRHLEVIDLIKTEIVPSRIQLIKKVKRRTRRHFVHSALY